MGPKDIKVVARTSCISARAPAAPRPPAHLFYGSEALQSVHIKTNFRTIMLQDMKWLYWWCRLTQIQNLMQPKTKAEGMVFYLICVWNNVQIIQIFKKVLSLDSQFVLVLYSVLSRFPFCSRLPVSVFPCPCSRVCVPQCNVAPRPSVLCLGSLFCSCCFNSPKFPWAYLSSLFFSDLCCVIVCVLYLLSHQE